MGYSPWGCKESNTTERLTHTHTHTHVNLLGSLVKLQDMILQVWGGA